MDHKSAVEKIAELEQRFDVNSVRYEGLMIWPLVRMALWTQLCHPVMKLMQEGCHQSTEPTSRLVSNLKGLLGCLAFPLKYVKSQRIHQRQLQTLDRSRPVDILFFSRAQYHKDEFGGKLYDRYLDPMIDFVKDRFNTLKFELKSEMAYDGLPCFEPAAIFDPRPFFMVKSLGGIPAKLEQRSDIENIDELNKAVVEATGSGLSLDERYLEKQADLVKRYICFFKEIFSVLCPEAVFFACYYEPIAMALVGACKEMGIVTVDIQHGKQGKYHGMYTHWTKIPEEGYELLPDFFWCWGEESKHNIENWYPAGCSHHKIIVGGNLWLAKWVHGYGDGLEISREAEAYCRILNGADKVILVTLQPLDDMSETVPLHVLKSMSSSPREWHWLIRLHPQQMAQKEQVRKYILQHGASNFEIDQSSSLPLYTLLKMANHHITCWSSVCYEALAFDVPTTIVHPSGLAFYGEYIKQGLFTYADDDVSLLRAIENKQERDGLRESVPYIEISKDRAEEALRAVFLGSSKQ
jgi:hypothetical protein